MGEKHSNIKHTLVSGGACAVTTRTWPWPNWAVKRTPTLAMASPSSWPVLVPSALSGSGAAYLGR